MPRTVSQCSKTPILATAVEIGVNAQMYLAEGKYELALEKFQNSLGLLLPLLPAECPGPRRDLLHNQVNMCVYKLVVFLTNDEYLLWLNWTPVGRSLDASSGEG